MDLPRKVYSDIPQIPNDVHLIYIIVPISVIACILYILFRIKIFRFVNKSFKLTLNTLYVEGLSTPNIEENILIKIKNFFDSMTNKLIMYNKKKINNNTVIKKINNNKKRQRK